MQNIFLLWLRLLQKDMPMSTCSNQTNDCGRRTDTPIASFWLVVEQQLLCEHTSSRGEEELTKESFI